jgi:hypothetical protein
MPGAVLVLFPTHRTQHAAIRSTTAILCTVLYSPLPCSTVRDRTLMNRLSPTPIVYTVHSLLIAFVLPPAGVSPTIYMVHALLLSPIPPPVPPLHGGTFLAVGYCTSGVQPA